LEDVGALLDEEYSSPMALRDAVRLATVDNFQGEESDVIILSLVRSNP
jgi:superfamily I DNA and/or RNA helicase